FSVRFRAAASRSSTSRRCPARSRSSSGCKRWASRWPSSGAVTTSLPHSARRRLALRRTVLVSLLPAAVTAASWLALESPRTGSTRVVAVALLAVGPVLASRAVVRAALLVVAAVLSARVAFAVSLVHPVRLAVRTAVGFRDGFLDFYDNRVPFD